MEKTVPPLQVEFHPERASTRLVLRMDYVMYAFNNDPTALKA